MSDKNKVKFGLKNVHVSILTTTTVGGVETYSYATPIACPGAVNLSMDNQASLTPFYADNRRYFNSYNPKAGYQGDLEIALIPDEIIMAIFNDTVDENGVLIENTDSQPNPFAFLFEFEGDKTETRHVLYNCTMTRPSIVGSTTGETSDPQTETATISASARADGKLHAKSTPDVDEAVYNNWYNSVYESTSAVDAAKLATLSIGALSLTPSFDADVTAYTATTSNASNAVTATGADDATVTIRANGELIDSGDSVTWNDGNNSVMITVSAAGKASTTYQITVIKSE